jgi:integrase
VPRLPKLPFVKFVRSKGAVYGYFNTGKSDANDKRIYAPMGKHSSVGFMDTYRAMVGHRTRRDATPVTVSDLADKFEGSAEFSQLAEGTRKFYTAQLKHVREHLGKFPINDVKRRHVAEVVNNRLGEQNGTRNGVLAVIGVLYTYARRLELTEARPAADIKPFKTGSHDPWPIEVLQAGLHAEHDRTRLAINLLYYTGARIGDAMRFRWSDIRDGVLYFTEQKRGGAQEVPLGSALLAELAQTPRRGLTIIVNEDGLPMTDQVVRKELKKFAAEQGHPDLVPHGLRKNAVNALLEAGCSVAEVQAITGQSFRMVEHYAKRVRRKGLGQAAIYKLEQNTNVQPTVETGPETRSKA